MPKTSRRLALAVTIAGAGLAGACNPPATSDAIEPDGIVEEVWTSGPSLPRPVANNAVVGLDLDSVAHVYSFMGIDESRQWDGVVSWAFRWVVGADAWEELTPVPGPPRLAATAEALHGKVYLFGGYTVAQDGSEQSLPNVDVFDPATDSWSSAAPMPTPVDDAVSGVWADSLIVIVSGWHNTDNVPDVQFFDPSANTWSVATSIPGPPVFGHAGKVVGSQIVYLGGANTQGQSPRYLIEPSAWVGTLDPGQPEMIGWEARSEHPAPLRYRAASVAFEDWVVFAGGTDNPYNYNGQGYNGVAAVPTSSVFGYHAPSGRWVSGAPLPQARMDHRALARARGRVVLVGGMDDQQRVRSEVFVANAEALLRSLASEL